MHNDSYINSRLKQINDDNAKELLPVMIFIVLLIVIGVFGNFIVCFVFVVRLSINTQNFLIICLAVNDFLNCLIGMPTEIFLMRYMYLFPSDAACRFLTFVRVICSFCSSFILLTIAIDRYLKVCHAVKRQISMHQAKVTLVVLLLISCIVSSPAILVYGISRIETDFPEIKGYHCFIRESIEDTALPIAYVIFLMLSFFFTLVALIVIYVRIWRYMKLHKSRMKFRSMSFSAMAAGDQLEKSARNSLFTSLTCSPQTNSSEDDVNNFKPHKKQNLDEPERGAKAVETCYIPHPLSMSSPLAINDHTIDTDYRSVPSPLTIIDHTIDTDYRSMPSPLTIIDHTIDTDYRSMPSPLAVRDNIVDTDHRSMPSPLIISDNIIDADYRSMASPQIISDNIIDADYRSMPSPLIISDNIIDADYRSMASPQIISDNIIDADYRSMASPQMISDNIIDADYRSMASPQMISDNIIDADYRSMPSPLAVSDDIIDTDSMSVLEDDELVNILFLFTSSSDKKSSVENVCQMAQPAPDIDADKQPTILLDTANISADIWPSSAALTIESEVGIYPKDDVVNDVGPISTGMTGLVNMESRRSFAVEVSTYRTTVIAMSITFVFCISYLPHLCMALLKMVTGRFDRHLKGVPLFFFNVFYRSYLINSVSNPIIYSVQNLRFRAEFLKLVREILICRK